jgi:hypothetical protein
MGQRVIKFSDLSGTEITDPKEEATVLVEFADKRRGQYHLDVTQAEAESFAEKGHKVVAERGK